MPSAFAGKVEGGAIAAAVSMESVMMDDVAAAAKVVANGPKWPRLEALPTKPLEMRRGQLR